jgi:two-component system cell cycle response regulator CpdR
MSTIMLVEDEALVRELLREVLEEDGVSVHAAEDGAAAMSLLEHARPTVLVTDINLGPGPDGFEVSRRARDVCPAVKVVYMSARPAQFAGQGVTGALMIAKPFDLERLAASIRAWYGEAVLRIAFGPADPRPI